MLTQIHPTPKYATRESALPPCAQKRIAQLRALTDDAEAARVDLQKRLSALRPDEAVERDEVDRRLSANNRALHYARALRNSIDDFLQKSGALAHVHPTVLKPAPGVKVGEPQWGRFENIRKRVTDLLLQINEVHRAPLPFTMVEAQLKIIVNKWASEGEPRVTVDQVRGHIEVGFGFDAAPKSHKVLTWLHKDLMLDRLTELAKKQADTRGEALSPEAKAEKLKRLNESLQDLELEEVAIVDTLQLQGNNDVYHRLDISPWALLGVNEPRGLMKSALVS